MGKTVNNDSTDDNHCSFNNDNEYNDYDGNDNTVDDTMILVIMMILVTLMIMVIIIILAMENNKSLRRKYIVCGCSSCQRKLLMPESCD